MPQDPTAALGALLRASTIQDDDEILRAANLALKSSSKDLNAQHTRVVALLKLDRFTDALRAIEQGGIALEAACSVEKAYALYKTGQLDEAAALIKSIGLEKRSLTHIAAQVAYRAERFDEARVLYKRMLDNDAAGEEHDMHINLKAAEAQADWQGHSILGYAQPENFDNFELCYNVACSHTARGEFEKASELLQRASRLCDAVDELSSDEKEAEMRPILAQQAYVYASLGKISEANDLLASVGQEDSDVDLNLIIETNRSAVDPAPQNPYLLQRKASSWDSEAATAKLFAYQTAILTRNSLIIDLGAQKVRGIASRTERALSNSQQHATDKSLISLSALNAAAETHGQTGNQLIKTLKGLVAKRPNEVGLILTLVQAQLQNGHPITASKTLEDFLAKAENTTQPDLKDARFSPGLIALAVSLFRVQGRESAAKGELVRAAKYWQDRPAGSATPLLKAVGIELSRSSRKEDINLAGVAFEKLLGGNDKCSIAAAGLVASRATTDLSAVEKHMSGLPSVESLISGIDVDGLLKTGVASVVKGQESLKRTAPSQPSTIQPMKKRRKRALPKNYVEGVTPDPERWLPLRDRSSYRPKGKKGKKKAQDSTQGGVVKEEETLELVGGGGVKVEKSGTGGVSGGGGGASGKKKKKKGKK